MNHCCHAAPDDGLRYDKQQVANQLVVGCKQTDGLHITVLTSDFELDSKKVFTGVKNLLSEAICFFS